MKKVIYLLGIMLFMAGAAKAQDENVQTGAEIEFERVVHDYGDVPYNGNGECEFRFTNTGDAPLLIQKPKSSCGCTIPSWPDKPIFPGESEVIKVTYRTTVPVTSTRQLRLPLTPSRTPLWCCTSQVGCFVNLRKPFLRRRTKPARALPLATTDLDEII